LRLRLVAGRGTGRGRYITVVKGEIVPGGHSAVAEGSIRARGGPGGAGVALVGATGGQGQGGY
jgi:hypothetical protein